LTGKTAGPMLASMVTTRQFRSAPIGLLLIVLAVASGCRTGAPPIRFAPAGTDPARLRSDYALTASERESLTADSLRKLTQDQVDQIYLRLGTGQMPDGPFRGDLFFPRGSNSHAAVRDLGVSLPASLSAIAAMPIEQLGRALWKGKVFFRSQGVVRNRIDDLAILKPIIKDSDTIPKLTFDGETTWLLFPAQLSCGPSLLEPAHRSIVIDYSKGPTIDGYREIPDSLAGTDALDIHDEVRIVKPGLYLGRAYFKGRFGLNFTLVKPGTAAAPTDAEGDCADASR
jgi:hypothetical protein